MLYLLIASLIFVIFPGYAPPAHGQNLSTPSGQVLGFGEVQRIQPAEQRSKVTPLSGTVLIELKMTQYSKIVSRNLKGEQKARTLEKVPDSFRLNANLESTQVFHVSGYNIEIKPLAWNRQVGQYKFGMRVNRLFGDYHQLEEFVGETVISGTLVQVAESKFSLLTSADLLFKDKANEPLVRIKLGSDQVDTLAKGARSQSAPAQVQ